MKISDLNRKNVEELLKLEFLMYWSSEKWKSVWDETVQRRFKKMLSDYIDNYKEYGIGLKIREELIGGIWLCRLNKVRTISYLHDPRNFFDENGNIAYVSVFVVRKGEKEKEIANLLYMGAEKLAIKKGCSKIIVVIYSSPIEVDILEERGYEIEINDVEWEIVPGMRVKCNIWSKSLSTEAD